MPVTGRQIIQAVSQLTELEEMQITFKESAKWAAITGAAVLTGGMLLGPVGLALGGIVGGVAGAIQGQGNFKSAAEIILNDLSASEQRQLAARLQGLLNNVLIEDVAVLAMFLTDNEHVRRQVIRVVTNFLANDLQMILSQ
ncbi:protein C19orf12 homolog [Ctenocephalides felis]|uniref:protein C19orf12 homolog n=1 Tax=Ctenocephalides felis TaxID=7515 RepID=UPI000E6E19E2|nr:protein C19orf12 homolog [Ctenocephalides felis]